MSMTSLLSSLKQSRQRRARKANRRTNQRAFNRRILMESLEERRLLAAVTTDLLDYAPGSTAVIVGTGFDTGETVELQVLHNDGTSNNGGGHKTWQVTDGSVNDLDGLLDGNIQTTWYVNPDDSANSSFELTATGLGSGLVATTEFTDSHFRGGGLSWETLSGNTVEFSLEQTWRRSAFGAPNVGSVVNAVGTLNFGAGQGSSNINIVVQSINLGQDSFTGTATITKSYSSSGAFTAFFESCCRISPSSGLQNNTDGSFRMESVVTPGIANDPPKTSVPALVSVSDNHIVQFPIPAFDPNGDTISFRLATSAEAGSGFTQPPGMTIDPTTGIVTWDIRNSVLNTSPGQLWSAQVMVTDSNGAKVPADFMLQIASATNLAPVFDVIPTTLTAVAGVPLTFSVQAYDPDSGTPVTLQALTPPTGMTFTAQSPTNGSTTSDSRLGAAWTPPISAAGSSFVLNFIATDSLGVSTFRGINVNVVNQSAVAINDGTYTVNEDNVLSVTAASGVLANDSDPDIGNLSDADNDGVPDYLDANPNNASISTNIGKNGLIALINTQVANGTVALSKDGSFTYTPTANFAGTDSFTYFANDGFSNSSPATVSITVNGVNDAPVIDLDGDDETGIDWENTFTEGLGAVSIADADATVTDIDGGLVGSSFSGCGEL